MNVLPRSSPRPESHPSESGFRSRWRPPARGMRRVRHFRPSRCRRHHRARPACAPASRPGSRRHRLLRRPAFSFRAPAGPGRRHLLRPPGHRPPARQFAPVGHVRYSTTGETLLRNVQPLFAELDPFGFAIGHNGNLTNGLTLRRAARARGRHHAVDHRHRGDPASGRALEEAALRRPLHRGPARARRRLFVRRPHQQEAGRRPRPARHPPAGARRARRLPDPVLGNLRARHHRREICARHREWRSRHLRRQGRAFLQAVPADGAAPLHLRIHLFLAAGFRDRRPLGLSGAQDHGRASSRAKRRPMPT